MRDLVDQLEASLEQPIYFLSLFMALVVPDIAGALESADGLASGKKYAAWYDKWARPQYGAVLRENLPPQAAAHAGGSESPMTGEACYRFRCSLLHQGTTQHPKSPYSRIIFVEPNTPGIAMHGNILKDALNIDARYFCREIILGARAWLDIAEGTETFTKNYDAFVRRYPQGLPPYIVGAPVIG